MNANDDSSTGSWHRIRLPAPWQVSRLAPSEASSSNGAVRFVRRFQRPTGLTDDDRAMLEIELRDTRYHEKRNAAVSLREPLVAAHLNGRQCILRSITSHRFQADLAVEHLLPVNELAISVHIDDNVLDDEMQSADLLESVALLLKS